LEGYVVFKVVSLRDDRRTIFSTDHWDELVRDTAATPALDA
jgi:hypothetical protein